MLALQTQQSVNPADVARARSAERRSRLRLMRSLLAMGEDLTLLSDFEALPALRATWLSSVNSMLAMDSSESLAPLLESPVPGPGRVQRLKAVATDVSYMLAVGCALWTHLASNGARLCSVDVWSLSVLI